MVKEKWIWDNIMDIYLKESNNYIHNDIIEITSHDNYFKCTLFDDGVVFRFKISIQHSPFSDTKYLFEVQNNILYPWLVGNRSFSSSNIDFYVKKLKPIFREYKLKELL